MKKQLKSRRNYPSILAKPAALVRTFNSNRPDPTPKEDKDKGKGKELARESGHKKCFKCHGYGCSQANYPNRRVLIIREIEDLDHMKIEQDEDASDEEGEALNLPPEEGEMLMIGRVPHATKVPREAGQREQIFHSRCKLADKICNLIIDGGSCTNVASTKMVSKLKLATIEHPKPHSLQWLKKGNEVTVSKQILVPFQLGNTSMR